jgi:catechol 2,3-dioxygenase-like lactoylglutathione lyase family enzyme
MKLMPIVYVADMDRAVDFYSRLGLALHSQSPMWSELGLGDAVLALHGIDTLPERRTGQIELALVAEEPLEAVAARLRTASIPLVREISDEAFGRSIMVRDPDGLLIQINEHVS